MLAAIAPLSRYISCGRVTKRPVFDFVDVGIHPNDALMVFPFEDDYSFGILQSDLHWGWFVARCSTLKGDFRYTSNTVFDTFPWPQAPTKARIRAVADAAVAVRKLRHAEQAKHGLSLRELYREMEKPGKHPLMDAHHALDAAVRAAYGATPKEDALGFLSRLNRECAGLEVKGKAIVGPGLPATAGTANAYVTTDRTAMP